MGKIRKERCCFCNSVVDDEIRYGEFLEMETVATHYFCLLLTTHIRQNGEDDEGIRGFLLDDIKKEVRRVKNVTCSYCKKRGASIYCGTPKCHKVFHLPCGLKQSSFHQFFGAFRTFCDKHRLVQKVDALALKKFQTDYVTCSICSDDLRPKPSPETIWAPCCNMWFHKNCLQKLALSSGYFFKCPLCCNKPIFEETMKLYGIFVPERDASWELVPNAYEELLQTYARCDAKICRAKSRSVNVKGKMWEIILCRYCGSQGTHKICGNLKTKRPVWECSTCSTVVNKGSDEDDEDEEISVDIESVPDQPSEVTGLHLSDTTRIVRSVTSAETAPQQEQQSPLQTESASLQMPKEQPAITYNTITDIEENISVVVSSSDSDIELVNYEPQVRLVDNHKYELKTKSGNYVEVVKLNENICTVPKVAGDIKVIRRKKIIQIDDSDIAEISEPESEYGMCD
ncbi:PHD finger protein 7-like [Schistocerca nitens]|uniref:PHD finger protein 7-like n=1 Tax=Schistocerca nitens TaxID=7011 RepID=UPI0021196BC3|nr:PHD finger protein 7-like [Schistocerca nitens]